MSSSWTLLVGVIAVVVIVVLLIVVATIAFNAAVDDAITADAEITVLSAAEVASPFWVPQSGYRFVELTVEMTNNDDSALTLSIFEFEMLTGTSSYPATFKVDNTLPSSILAGQTTTFRIAFEVPKDENPALLVFQEMFSANELATGIGPISPVVYKITIGDVSVDTATSEYFPAQEGYEYVMVSLTMTNDYDEAISLYSFDFQLETTDGLLYDCTWAIDDTIPDGLASGATATFSMAFEIPDSATPDVLVFDAGGFVLEAEIQG